MDGATGEIPSDIRSEVCRYGTKCYRESTNHLQNFRHPHRKSFLNFLEWDIYSFSWCSSSYLPTESRWLQTLPRRTKRQEHSTGGRRNGPNSAESTLWRRQCQPDTSQFVRNRSHRSCPAKSPKASRSFSATKSTSYNTGQEKGSVWCGAWLELGKFAEV